MPQHLESNRHQRFTFDSAWDSPIFPYAVDVHPSRSFLSTFDALTSIPRPVIDHLGKGKKVEAIMYAIKGARVEVKLEQSHSET